MWYEYCKMKGKRRVSIMTTGVCAFISIAFIDIYEDFEMSVTKEVWTIKVSLIVYTVQDLRLLQWSVIFVEWCAV